MGWAIDTVVTPILEKTKYNAKDAVSFTTPNGISVHTLGYSKDAIQIAYLKKIIKFICSTLLLQETKTL